VVPWAVTEAGESAPGFTDATPVLAENPIRPTTNLDRTCNMLD